VDALLRRKSMKTITAPWTEEQVENLNKRQERHDIHPYTCGRDGCGGVLVATEDGWVCPNCDYNQKWAHSVDGEGMIDPYDVWDTLTYEQKLCATRVVFDKIGEHMTEGGTYRYLIYDRLGFDYDAYSFLYPEGLGISNMICDWQEYTRKKNEEKDESEDRCTCDHYTEIWFDRTMDEYGDMHDRCCECGRIADGKHEDYDTTTESE
jgi:hypothetical protein